MALLTTDPLVFARDDCGDLIVPLRIARGLEAVLILVRAAIMLWRDEYYLDRDAGMPWLETTDGVVREVDAILGQPFDPAKLQRAVRILILRVTAVRSISEFKATFDGEARAVAMSMVVHSDFGDSPLSISVPTL